MKNLPVTISLIVCFFSAYSQKKSVKKPREYRRAFQVALFPGISTNGINSGHYQNDFSFNFFGGLSASNRILEIGLISNAELNSTTGIQLAGLANIVGVNTFLNLTLSQQRELEHGGFESNQKGFQVAGFLNYVRMNSCGFIFSGAFNIAGRDFTGVQIAGIGNSSGGEVYGFQIGGLYNLAEDGIGGIQISSLYNYTRGRLAGLQLAIVNRASRSLHDNSSKFKTNGVQIGLLNFSKEMDGLQIGLINFGGQMHGRQIGLLNFFNRYPPKDNIRNGTPVGLLNFGSMGTYVRVLGNELFPLNIEITTGNCSNCSPVPGSNMPYAARWKKFNQNALLVGYDWIERAWGFGYGFQRILFNKFVMTPRNKIEARLNERQLISYGIKFIHLNPELKNHRAFNMVSRFNIEYGVRTGPVHFFGGLALSYFLQDANEPAGVFTVRSFRIPAGKMFGCRASLWPGYTIGFHFK